MKDFVKSIAKATVDLLHHHHVSKAQSKSFADLKANLKDDEIILTGDYSENYKYVVQDESQSKLLC